MGRGEGPPAARGRFLGWLAFLRGWGAVRVCSFHTFAGSRDKAAEEKAGAEAQGLARCCLACPGFPRREAPFMKRFLSRASEAAARLPWSCLF